MKLNKLFTVAALAAVSVVSNFASATATTYLTFDQGVNLTSYHDGNVFGSNGSPVLPATFDYTYNFNLNPASAFTSIVSGWAGVNYSGFSASLTGTNNGTHYFTESVGSGGQSVLSLGSLSGDSSYSLHIQGTAGSGSGATFNVNLSSVAAVPEPETFAMLLAGLGLVGMVARRRNKVSTA